jgi:hypothetical protein
MSTNQTQSLLARACPFLVILACAVLVLGFARGADASPFMLNLLSSGSSGGGGGHAGVATNDWSASRLGLNLGGSAGRLSNGGGSRITDPSTTTPPTMLSSSPSATAQTLTEAVKSGLASLTTSGSLAHLDLGNGETLSVSGAVVDSIVSSVSGSTSATSGGAANRIEPSQPHTDAVVNDVTSGIPGTTPTSQSAPSDTSQGSQALLGTANSAIDAAINSSIDHAVPGSLESTAPDEIVKTVFAEITSGIVSTPAGITNLSSADLVAAAEDPIHAPEPATLVLFGTALALTAHRLRRRR